MNKTNDAAAIETSLEPAPTRVGAHFNFLLVAVMVALGIAAVFLLRQDWAKPELWPWILFSIIVIIGAFALKRLDGCLPGERIAAQVVRAPAKRRQLIGVLCFIIAIGLVGVVVWRLWPNYFIWDGTFPLWLAAIVLVLIGGWLIGAVGEVSARAATAIMMWRDTPRNRWLEVAAFILILALAIFLRTFRLDSIPPGIFVDETNGSLDALQILEDVPISPFATGWYQTPNGYFYYMAAVYKLLGVNWVSLKVVSLIPAILTVPAVYLLARLLFGPSAGLFAMLLLAVSRWHLTLSRWGWNEVAPPLFQVMAFFFLVRGLRDRRALDYTLSGLIAGLTVYTYLSSRLAVATLLLYAIYWFISDPSGIRASLRKHFFGFLLLGIAALITVGPLMVTYLRDPFIANNRVSEVSVFRNISDQGSIAPLLGNIADILRFFHQVGDNQSRHNLPGEPMADPVTGLLFAIGLFYAIFSWRDSRRVLLLLWLVIGLAGSFLSSELESPQAYRALNALPAVVLMAADVLDRIVRTLYRFLRELPFMANRRYIPTFVAGGVAGIALGSAAIWESSIYFGRQAESLEVVRGFNFTENRIAHETISALEAGKTVYLSPNFSHYSPLRFLLYGLIKAETGENSLNNPPFHVVLPEVNLPLPDDGNDILMLLELEYWSLRDYITSLYPDATMELVTMIDGTPAYMRVELPQEQVAALHGLNERLTFADGTIEERTTSQIMLDENDGEIVEAVWEGAIRMEHGGEYDLIGEGGIEVYIDGQRWTGRRYLGSGLYGLRVVLPNEPNDTVQLLWQFSNGEPRPIPTEMLFNLDWPQHGLLGSYYPNANWEGEPVFQQVAPFLLLAWADEIPIVYQAQFSARFEGTLRITEPGTYRLKVDADDGARLILDGEVIGEGLIPNQPNGFEVNVELTRGDHPIEIEYFQNGGGTALRVFWRRNEESFSAIPPSALIPAEPGS